MKAIPTNYAGTKFRSRPEAKWAATLDILGWRWEYEPLDLDGYIPDFILLFHKPLLVEVKPALNLADLGAHTDKIDNSGWEHEALIVGATIDLPGGSHAFGADHPALGLLREGGWAEALGFRCRECGHPSFFHLGCSFFCRASGCGDGDHHLGDPGRTFQNAWAEAGNLTQWRAAVAS